MKIIAFFFKHSPKAVLWSVLAGIVSGACNAALLAVISAVVKRNGSTSLLLWSFVGLCVLLPMTRFFSEYLLTHLGQGATFNLRMHLCRQILAAPLRHLEQVGAHRVLAALMDDVPAITAAILIIPLLCVNAALVVGCLVYMGLLSPVLLVIVLGFMVIGIVSYQIPILKVQSIFERARKDGATLQRHFRVLTQGMKELKMHNRRRRAFFDEHLTMTADSLRRYNTAGQNLYSAAASWGQTLVFVVIGLILFALPHFRALTSNMIVAYALALLYLMTPLQILLNTLPQVSRANVALKNSEDLGFILAKQGSEEAGELPSVPYEWNSLELESVTHTYHREGESEDFVLGPIALRFKPGELAFITGGNGSGKTTLVKLLIGLYQPEKGRLLLDGEPIGDHNREMYRQYFSAVFSDFYLFDELLGLIKPKLDNQAREFLARLKLSHKVQIVDGKLSTTELSQGQRKRLALLTAYLEDRPIYIFDEWAADQDPQFKSVFYLQLLPELKRNGKTVLVISHDDRYYGVADRIIKLDDGQLVSDVVNTGELIAAEAAT